MRTGDGRIVLANRGTYELRWYDVEGRFLWSAGRRGEGPGEFRWLTWATLFEGDSVLAYDSQLRRASIFSPAGEFVRARLAQAIVKAGLRYEKRAVLLGLLIDAASRLKADESERTRLTALGTEAFGHDGE